MTSLGRRRERRFVGEESPTLQRFVAPGELDSLARLNELSVIGARRLLFLSKPLHSLLMNGQASKLQRVTPIASAHHHGGGGGGGGGGNDLLGLKQVASL